ncbi:MAG TPA: glycosyltransferase [Nitrospira sp.]|nr:glycosyltransferase [Nitrospira sp.]
MVFVTVGSASKGFRRLLEAVDQLAGAGAFGEDPVLMQVGPAAGFIPLHCEARTFVSREGFQQFVQQASLIICHGGATPLEIIRAGKVPIVMPRRKKYGEIVNDHQVEFVRALTVEGRVIPAMEPEDLPEAIAKARQLNVTRRPLPSSPMVSLVAQALEELTGGVVSRGRNAA